MIVGLIYGKITSVTTTKSTIYYVTHIGDWPSGKAPGSGPVIGGSNPSSPAKLVLTILTKPLPCRVEVFGLGHIEQPNYCALGSNNVLYEYAFI